MQTPSPELELLSVPIENAHTRMLAAFIGTGLFFMLFPGTLLGVWNLFEISSRQSPESVSSGWIQAHGHAQLFGWMGCFILGISLYVLPKMRGTTLNLSSAWSCWVLWTIGNGARWFAGVDGTGWTVLLPVSAVAELLALLIFANAVFGAAPAVDRSRLRGWQTAVIAGFFGLGAALVLQTVEACRLSIYGIAPVFAAEPNLMMLNLAIWGFAIPVAWGYSARWCSPFLGVKNLRPFALQAGLLFVATGLVLHALNYEIVSSALLALAPLVVVSALRLFEPRQREARSRGVHESFPWFVRIAYIWLLVGGALGLWSALSGGPKGLFGASRHALTVGFLATMVFSFGPRILPAFAGLRRLFSPLLMLLSLSALTVGCTLRVVSQILAYQGWVRDAWRILPVSALIEMAAVMMFAVNLAVTFVNRKRLAKLSPAAISFGLPESGIARQ